MPNARKLTILTEARTASGVTLEQMARACGFTGTKSRESVAAWEHGHSIPRTRYRPKIIDYLGHTLGLRHDPVQFHRIWNVLAEEWNWEPVDEAEWFQHFDAPGLPHPASHATSDAATLARAVAIRAQMPTHARIPAPAALPSGSRMPLHRNPFFAGRETELLAVARALATDKAVPVYPVMTAAITGMAGVGKTQLACEFVHRYGRYFAGGVFWLRFADPEGIPGEIAACGGSGCLALRPDFGELALHNQVELVLAAWRSPLPRLLVFDNCEDETVLARWRPTTGGCAVIVTSQRSLWTPTLGVVSCRLNVLDRGTSVGLLQTYLGTTHVQPQVLDAIAAEVGDLPLALHLAGQYLARYAYVVTPEDYLAQLQAGDLIRHTSLQGSAMSPTSHGEHVERTFMLSLSRLDATDATDVRARRLLAHAAYFPPGEGIPRDLLLATLSTQDQLEQRVLADDALRRLVEIGFVQVEHEGALRLHRLVVQWVLTALGDSEAEKAVELTILGTAQKLAENHDYPAIVRVLSLLRFSADRSLRRGDETAAALATALGHHLWIASDFTTAQAYLEQALQIRERALQQNPLAVAETLNILGLAVQIQLKLDVALGYAQRALAIWEAHLGPDHPSTDAEVNNIGYIHMLRGEYGQAWSAFRRSLRTRHRIYGLHHPETARILHNIGVLSIKRGEFRVAHRYLRLALAIREQVIAMPHPSTAITLNHLGEIHYWLQDYSCALAYHHRALTMRQYVFGDAHVGVAESLTNIGRILRSQGDTSEARAYQEQALAMHETLGTTTGYDAAFTGDELGVLLYEAGEYAKAQTYLEHVLSIWQRSGNPEHPERIAPLNHLALVMLAQGELMAAQSYADEALHLCRAKLGEQHPWIRETLAVHRYIQTYSDVADQEGSPSNSCRTVQTIIDYRGEGLGT